LLRTILNRLVTALVTLFVCSVLIFGYRYLIPGGPAADIADLSQLSAGSTPTQLTRQINALKIRFGLNKPIPVQYYDWADGVLHGHLGTSFYSGSSVTTVIGQRMAASAELIVGALVISLLIGVPLGIYAAIRRGRPTGRIVLAISGLQISVPDFWIATINAAVFGLILHWFPSVGFVPLSAGLWANLDTMILPILTLAIIPTAFLLRHLQSSLSRALTSGQGGRSACRAGSCISTGRCATPLALSLPFCRSSPPGCSAERSWWSTSSTFPGSARRSLPPSRTRTTQ
jgi:peptide/nickel transport system permease protein